MSRRSLGRGRVASSRAALAGAVTGSLIGGLLTAQPADAGWADRNCWFGDQYEPVSAKTRDVMAFGMYYMRWEGYHWGGECANDNNVDDQPGDPERDERTHGEGTDCSGFVRKAWGITPTWDFGRVREHGARRAGVERRVQRQRSDLRVQVGVARKRHLEPNLPVLLFLRGCPAAWVGLTSVRSEQAGRSLYVLSCPATSIASTSSRSPASTSRVGAFVDGSPAPRNSRRASGPTRCAVRRPSCG